VSIPQLEYAVDKKTKSITEQLYQEHVEYTRQVRSEIDAITLERREVAGDKQQLIDRLKNESLTPTERKEIEARISKLTEAENQLTVKEFVTRAKYVEESNILKLKADTSNAGLRKEPLPQTSEGVLKQKIVFDKNTLEQIERSTVAITKAYDDAINTVGNSDLNLKQKLEAEKRYAVLKIKYDADIDATKKYSTAYSSIFDNAATAKTVTYENINRIEASYALEAQQIGSKELRDKFITETSQKISELKNPTTKPAGTSG
jgi:phage-related protein